MKIDEFVRKVHQDALDYAKWYLSRYHLESNWPRNEDLSYWQEQFEHWKKLPKEK